MARSRIAVAGRVEVLCVVCDGVAVRGKVLSCGW